jgi:hypothetical protein
LGPGLLPICFLRNDVKTCKKNKIKEAELRRAWRASNKEITYFKRKRLICDEEKILIKERWSTMLPDASKNDPKNDPTSLAKRPPHPRFPQYR